MQNVEGSGGRVTTRLLQLHFGSFEGLFSIQGDEALIVIAIRGQFLVDFPRKGVRR